MKVLGFKGSITKLIDKHFPAEYSRMVITGHFKVLYKGAVKKLSASFLLGFDGVTVPEEDELVAMIREEIAVSNTSACIGCIDRVLSVTRFTMLKNNECNRSNSLSLFLPEIASDDELILRGNDLLASMDRPDLEIHLVQGVGQPKETENGFVFTLEDDGVEVTFANPITRESVAYFSSHIEAYLDCNFVYEGIKVVLDENAKIDTFTGFPLSKVATLLRNRLDNV